MAQEEITPSPQAAQAVPITPTETVLPKTENIAPVAPVQAAPQPVTQPVAQVAQPQPATAPATLEQAGQQAGVSVPPSPQITPQQVYSAENIKQAATEPSKAPDYSKMSVDELAKEIASATSAAELQQANIMNRRIAQGVNVGQAAHEARLATARINALSGLKTAKEQELARKMQEEELKVQRQREEEDRKFQKEQQQWAREDREFEKQMRVLDMQTKKAALSQKALAKGASPVIARVSQLEQQFGKGEWGKIAEQLANEGFDVGSGSEADLELNRRYNPENYQRMVDAIKGKTKSAEGGKTLTATTLTRLSDASTSLKTLDTLEAVLSSPDAEKLIGPAIGRLGSNYPYASEAQALRGQLQVAAQTIGKYLEGGKMTDSDREFYQQNIPSMNDTPEVAMAKLRNLKDLLNKTKESEIDTLDRAGYDVSGFKDFSALQSTSNPDEWLSQSLAEGGGQNITPEEDSIYSQFGL